MLCVADIKRQLVIAEFTSFQDSITFHKRGRFGLEKVQNPEEAIKREIEEELNIKLDYKLISVEENIVKSNKFHMLEFVYCAEIDNFDSIECLDDGWDKFKIVEIKDIDNIDIRPKTVKDLIKNNTYTNVSHNVNYDWA